MRKIWQWFGLFGVVVLTIFLQQFPNYYAAQNTPPGYYFTGQVSWFDPWDINVYVTAIRYGQEGSVLLKNHYTTNSTAAALIYPIYTLAGYIFPNYDPFIIFHVLASVVIIILVVSIFYFFYHRLSTFYLSLSATIVCIIGSGFGWLPPYDTISAGRTITSFNFKSAIQRGHEGIGTLLYISIVYLTYLHFEQPTSKRRSMLIFLLSLLLIIFYPYYLLSYFVIIAAYILYRYRTKIPYTKLILFLGNCLITGLVTIVYYLHLQESDFYSAASEVLPNVTIGALILGYGNFIAFFILSFFLKKKQKRETHFEVFLILWVILSIALAYLPGVGFSRFYLRGLFFPLTLLVFTHLDALTEKYLIKLVVPIIIMFFTFSRFTVFNERIQAVSDLNQWTYMPLETKAVLDFLEERGRDGILSFSYNVSNLIPPFTSKSVYIGHLLQTPDVAERIAEVHNFRLHLMTPEEAYEFLKRSHITFVLYEKNSELPIAEAYPFLEERFENELYIVYSVE